MTIYVNDGKKTSVEIMKEQDGWVCKITFADGQTQTTKPFKTQEAASNFAIDLLEHFE